MLDKEQVTRLLQRVTSESLGVRIVASTSTAVSSGPLSLNGIPWDGTISLQISASITSTIRNRITDRKTSSSFQDGSTIMLTQDMLSDVPTLESTCHWLAMNVVSGLETKLMEYLFNLIPKTGSPK